MIVFGSRDQKTLVRRYNHHTREFMHMDDKKGMSSMVRYCMIGILALFLTACATTQAPISFTPLPPVAKSGDEAWIVLLDTISNFYPNTEHADKASGHIRTSPIIIEVCWAGILYGGLVPCELERFTAQVSSLSPFHASIAVERHKATAMSNYRAWYSAGNNSQKEQLIYDRIISNLSTSFQAPERVNDGQDVEVNMPSYSLIFKECDGWDIKQYDATLEKLSLARTDNAVEYKIQILRNAIKDEERQIDSPYTLAGNYIESELAVMKEYGEKPMIYQVSDVVKRSEMIGSREFFVLDYKQKNKAGIQDNSMYLLFPSSRFNKYFIVAHYTEFVPEGVRAEHTYRHNFRQLLESLSTN